MAAFRTWLECAGTGPARCFAGRFAADESASGGWRMREWPLFCAIGQRGRGARHSPRTICGAPISPRERDAGADLPKSIAFFKALGFSHNPQSTDDTGACIVVSDTILVMLLTHARFRDFTPTAICDTSKAAEVLLTFSCESREQVDGLVAKAVAAGGSTYDKPEDYGFMYTHSFVGPDGHGWGLVHMNAMPAQT